MAGDRRLVTWGLFLAAFFAILALVSGGFVPAGIGVGVIAAIGLFWPRPR